MTALPYRLRYRVSDRRIIDNTFRREVAEFAARTSQKNAARLHGVSHHAVRMWMLALGLRPRPARAPTNKEIARMGSDYVEPTYVAAGMQAPKLCYADPRTR